MISWLRRWGATYTAQKEINRIMSRIVDGPTYIYYSSINDELIERKYQTNYVYTGTPGSVYLYIGEL